MIRLILALAALIGACLTGVEAHALDRTKSLKQFHHTAWTIRDGMPGNILAMAQTPDGYLWLGTVFGLYRFDGVRVELFEHRPPGVSVSSLAVTDAGDLWIGSNGGISRLSHGVFTTFSTPGLAPTSRFLHIAPGRNGDVWVATESQVVRFNGHGWQVMGSDWGTSDNYTRPGGIWGLAVARDGVVWSKNLLGLYYLRPGAMRFVKADGYAGGMIDFARAADGRLWTADYASQHFYALPDLGPTGAPPGPSEVGAATPPGFVGEVKFDRDGALWCANPISGGLYRVRSVTEAGATAEVFTVADGLSNAVTRTVLEDREGDILAGTAEGLDRFTPANIMTDSVISIRPSGADIAALSTGVYVTDGWSLARPAASRHVEKLYRITNGSPEVLSLGLGGHSSPSGASSNGLLVTDGPRLARIQGTALSWITLPDAAKGAEVVSAAENGRDLWIVVPGRGVFRRRGGVWTRAPNVTANLPTRIRLDQQGALWIFDRGAPFRRLAGDRIDAYAPLPKSTLGGVYAFVADARGVLLGGPFGVARFDGRAFHELSQTQAPFLVGVAGIVSDGVGGTWFHTPSGIYRVATQQLEHAFVDPKVRLDYQLLDARDGLTSTATLGQFGGSAVRGPDGRLWFLNVGNVAWIDPRHLYRNLVPPPVSIRSLTAGGRVFDGATVRTLPAGTSNLQIDYAALSLQNPERVRLRYRLDGVDKAWVDAGARRQAFYTRLGPGRYRFQVIAANNDGVWNSTGAALRFEIPPTFLQSWWFFVLCTSLAGLALWMIYRLRVRQVMVAMQSRLEERVTERERIARELHDTLLQGFQGVILRFQAILGDLPAGQPTQLEMESALERADEVLISARSSVRHLRAMDRAGDLAAALTDAARAESAVSDAQFQLILEGAARALHPIVGEELAAIGREAISNAFHHARAQSIDAQLTYSRRGLLMRIVDDGAGIDADVLAAGGRKGHFGLLGMRERADKIQAKFTVSSRLGSGVEIVVTAPAHIAFVAAQGDVDLWRRLRGAFDHLVLPPNRSRSR